MIPEVQLARVPAFQEIEMLKIVLAVLACFSLLVSAGCAGKGVGKGKAPISTRG